MTAQTGELLGSGAKGEDVTYTKNGLIPGVSRVEQNSSDLNYSQLSRIAPWSRHFLCSQPVQDAVVIKVRGVVKLHAVLSVSTKMT